MKYIRQILDRIFYIIHPLFRPARVQLFLSKYISLPYSMTQHLDYKGIVPFTVGRKKLFMRSYNTPIEITVFWRGIFGGREGAELNVWSQLSQRASLAIDIGANNGIYSLVSSANHDLEVHAFEPVPRVYEMLLENLKLNDAKNITPHQAVVSHTDGIETLFVPKEGWVDVASLDQKFASQYTDGRELTEVRCTSLTLDRFLQDRDTNDSEMIICKIDVEGGEPLVLRGAKDTIAKKNIVFLIEALDEKAFDEVKAFFPINYRIFGVDSRRNKLFETTISSDDANNYIFVKDNALESVQSIVL